MFIDILSKGIEAQKALLSESLVNVSIAYLVAFVLFLISYSKQIKKLILISIFLFLCIDTFELLYLVASKQIDIYFLIFRCLFSILLFSTNFNQLTGKKTSIHLKYSGKITEIILTMYLLNTALFFKVHYFMKIIFILLYSVSLILTILQLNNNAKYIRLLNNTKIGTTIINKKGNANFPTMLPYGFLLPNIVFQIMSLILWTFEIHRSKFNFGIYDTRNRNTSITFNTDIHWFYGMLIWIVSALSILGINTYSLFYSCLVICIYRTLRYSNSSISKYLTTVIGTDTFYGTNLYDNLLNRVIPDKNLGLAEKSFLPKKEYSYSIYFLNMEYCYDPKLGFIHFDKLINNSYHTICKFSAVDNSMNLISEHCLNRALQNPLSIIDIWNIKHPGSHLFGDISGFNDWTEKRLSIMQKLTDESFLLLDKSIPSMIKEKSSSREMIAEKSQLKAALVNTNSFEALKINIDISENYYNELDRENLFQISQNGIFEFTTLFRQLHENPSISSRFVDLLNISECICRYLIGIIHGIWQHNNNTEHQIVFDAKTIAYGSCVEFLRKYNNLKDTGNHIDSKIHSLLELKYDDIDNIEAITTYLKMLNPHNKVSRSPKFIDLHSWLVEIRNKTRGHGTPSKVDFNFYIALEKVVLFMIAKFNNLNLKLVYKSDIGGDQWTFNMSMGGFPGIVPVINKIEPNIHFNPFTSKDLINYIIATHNEIIEKIIDNKPHPYFVFQTNHINTWIPCDSFFKIIQGVVYILNGRQNEKESWISFSTGKIVRPSKI